MCSTLGKILEQLVRSQLIDMVQAHAKMQTNQHEFIIQRVTITNLLTADNLIATHFNAGNTVDLISIEFSRAFNKVSYGKLLAVLHHSIKKDTVVTCCGCYRK